MADEPKKVADEPTAQAQLDQLSTSSAIDAQIAAMKAQLGQGPPAPAGPTPGLDQTIPGGRYIVDGIAVNAEGEPLDTKKR